MIFVAAVLAVAASVTANQVLNNGVWSLWWGVAAVAATVASIVAGSLLTKASPAPEEGGPPAFSSSSAAGAQDPPADRDTGHRPAGDASTSRAYQGDHIDFSHGTFAGPVTGKQVTGPADPPREPGEGRG